MNSSYAVTAFDHSRNSIDWYHVTSRTRLDSNIQEKMFSKVILCSLLALALSVPVAEVPQPTDPNANAVQGSEPIAAKIAECTTGDCQQANLGTADAVITAAASHVAEPTSEIKPQLEDIKVRGISTLYMKDKLC